MLFTDVRGFTAWTASHDYSQVFDFLFEMCTKFDEAFARHKVTKISDRRCLLCGRKLSGKGSGARATAFAMRFRYAQRYEGNTAVAQAYLMG